MVLVVAEKPSVANTIATVLGANEKNVGYLSNEKYIVSSCLGHLVRLDEPDAYGKQFAQKPWEFKNLPIIPDVWKFSINGSTKSQYYILKHLMLLPEVDEIVCATDAGREGECIFRYVYNKIGCKKPVKRLWTSSLEKAAIIKGFEELKDDLEYDNLYAAGLARNKADWLVGFNATRIFSIRYRTPLSIGRVQTPTLAMIVERNNNVVNFIKERFYTVDISCEKFTARSEKIDNEYTANKLLNDVENTTFFVKDITSTSKSASPPKLYDLTTLQRDANRIYGYSAQQTLDYLQSLYEKKLSTYPRTDSQYITDDMHETACKIVNCVFDVFDNIPKVKFPDINILINNKKVSDHHALLPTAEIMNSDLSSLPTSEYNILFLIALRLCAAVSEIHKYEIKTAYIVSEKSDAVFSTTEKIVIDNGWKTIMECLKETNDNDEIKKLNQISELKKGQKFTSLSVGVSEHLTSPPKQFTEDTLLSAMETAGNTHYDKNSDVEKKGLGTPATRAGIIENLVSRGYVVREKKKLLPTDKGIKLISFVPNEVKSPQMTAEWEMQLHNIEKGILNENDFLSEVVEFVNILMKTYASEDECNHFKKEWECIGKCPNCGKHVLAYPKSYSCEDRDCGFTIWKNVCGKLLSAKQAQNLLTKGRTDLIKGFKTKAKKTFDAYLVLNSENKTEFQFQKCRK